MLPKQGLSFSPLRGFIEEFGQGGEIRYPGSAGASCSEEFADLLLGGRDGSQADHLFSFWTELTLSL